MPWKGWDERQVRGASFSANTSSMGFTPINKPFVADTAAATTPDSSVTRLNRTDQSNANDTSQLPPAQDDTPEQFAAPRKKVTTKSRKRAAPPAQTSRAKKRRTSSVKDNLTVSKGADQPVSEPGNTKSHASAAKPTSDKINTKRSTPKLRQRNDAVSTNEDSGAPTAAKSISVYASATSMDALDSTSSQTSFNSVKANAGKSFTVYQGAASSSSLPTNVDIAQPWMRSSGKADRPATTSSHATSDTQMTSNTAFTAINVATPPITVPEITNSQTTAKLDEKDDNDGPNVGDAADQPITVEDSDDEPRRSTRLAKKNNLPRRPPSQEFLESVELSGIDDEDLVNFARTVEEAIEERPSTPSKRSRKDNVRDVEENEDYGGALMSQADKDMIRQMKAKHDKAVKPIVRKPFLPPVLDRSPIFGASKGTVLRTCFRVGEALNTGSQAVRCGNNAVIELYARVTASWREPKPSRKQHFVFKDLYHDHPPHLPGTYELWDQAELWDLDSKSFLTAKDGPGMICRMIGKMKRDGSKWRVEVLSIWEASWEDVNYVAGIYTDCVAGEDGEDDDD